MSWKVSRVWELTVAAVIALFPVGFLMLLISEAIKLTIGKGFFLTLVNLLGYGLWAVATIAVDKYRNRSADTHGTARLANRKEVADLYADEGVLIGRDLSGKLLRYADNSHLLTIAPTRSGKGVGTIVPNLLTVNRSIVCIDPKGENAKITQRARNQFGQVHILDPFNVVSDETHAYNPLESLDIASLDIADDVTTLADALVCDAPGEGGEAHWNEEAKALISGLILHVLATEPPERRNLSTVREYLTASPEAFSALLHDMQQIDVLAFGLIARAANRQLGKSDREASSVLSVAQRHTHFLDSIRMGRVLNRSDFSFADLKRGTATVFLVLPPERLSAYYRWLRLMVTQSLRELSIDRTRPAKPIVYLLDEFAALGHLAPIEQAMGLMAGYGIQLWPILQDIHQLRGIYGKKADTFLSNAGVLQFFGVSDYESAQLVSNLTGQTTVVYSTESSSAGKFGSNQSEQHTGRPLFTPDEVRTLPLEQQLLFVRGKHPILAKKLRYYADPEFQGFFDPV